MQTFYRDIRYAARNLRRSPAFTATVVLTLALGVGATAAIFSCVYALLLQSLPFTDAGRIIALSETHPQITGGIEATYPDYEDWKEQQHSFTQLAAYSTLNPETVSLVTDGHAQQVHRVLASGNFFSVLGITPRIGRLIGEQDDKPENDHVAMLSASAWDRYFGNDPGIVGRSVNLNGTAFTIIGVLPVGAAYPSEGEVWLPLSLLDQETRASRVWHSVRVLGRLRPGVKFPEARADLQAVSARLAAAYPATNRNIGVQLRPLREELVGTLRPAMLSLFGAVFLVLLIACANVANLLMVRATAQRREIAVRQALGAGRTQFFFQFLAQAIVLCLLGGSLGIALAAGVLPLLRMALAHAASLDPSMIQSIGLNIPVLLFALFTCLMTAILFSIFPLMNTSPRLTEALRTGERGSTGSRSRKRSALIAGEIAIAVVVLFLSTLVVRSFQKLLAVDPGFRIDHLLSAEITLPEPKYGDDSSITNHFYEQLLENLARSPGISSAATTTVVPLKPSQVMTRFLVEGAPPTSPGIFPAAQIRYVSPDFFHTFGLALQSGRVFEQKDIENSTKSFVVNAAFARRYLAGRNPLDANILLGVLSPHPEKIPVIGVVSDAHDLGIESEAQPEIYLPGFGLHAVLLVRTFADPASVESVVQNAVRTLDPNQPIYHVQTVDALMSNSTARQRMTAMLLGIFSVVALALAAIGIYGVLSYSVAQRSREIGVRMAVGATRARILRLVLAQAAQFTGTGLAVGVGVALVSARIIRGLLFDIGTADPLSACIAIGLLVLAAVVAATIPALRAASVNPNEALRAE
ncbi:ABC transporter permease [Terracidiphilus gabretensis]|uniref:ABC transporter permease n=1 Tax=Terracidiphilus gabretensis TaxID=1577687 RepID=UPI00071BBFAC|nr:ABC transporter permease [Terracidiphilus gabretensis]